MASPLASLVNRKITSLVPVSAWRPVHSPHQCPSTTYLSLQRGPEAVRVLQRTVCVSKSHSECWPRLIEVWTLDPRLLLWIGSGRCGLLTRVGNRHRLAKRTRDCLCPEPLLLRSTKDSRHLCCPTRVKVVATHGSTTRGPHEGGYLDHRNGTALFIS